MDDYGTTSNLCGRCSVVCTAILMIVYQGVGIFVPYLHAEQVHIGGRGELFIDGGEYKTVATATIDCPSTLVLGPMSLSARHWVRSYSCNLVGRT